MRGTVVIDDLAELERAGDPAFVAEQLVQRLARVRQERCEENLQAVDAAERNEEHRARAPAIGVHQSPRSLGAEVPVDTGGQRHHLGQPGLEPGSLDLRRDGPEAGFDLGDHRLVDVEQFGGLGHGGEVPVRALERPVDEVAPRRHQLVVVAADELV